MIEAFKIILRAVGAFAFLGLAAGVFYGSLVVGFKLVMLLWTVAACRS